MRDIRYADSDGCSIAYEVFGAGPRDLVFVHGWVTNVELLWEHPRVADAMERLGSFCRVIHFDKRGTGLSDRVPVDRLPTLEQRMDDVRAVMDAAGSRRAVLFGHSEGGPDGPARAVRWAQSVTSAVRELGLRVRAGVHTGEIERRGTDVGGLAVHIAARIADLAEADEVLTSRTVKDLVAGSGITFSARGTHALKGVPEHWDLYAAT